MTVTERANILAKTDGHCAYCGTLLNGRWQVDHVLATRRGGSDEDANKMPACVRCNRWKATYTVDEFRAEITEQFDRLKRDIPGFRLAIDFSLIQRTGNLTVFYYEQMGHNA